MTVAGHEIERNGGQPLLPSGRRGPRTSRRAAGPPHDLCAAAHRGAGAGGRSNPTRRTSVQRFLPGCPRARRARRHDGRRYLIGAGDVDPQPNPSSGRPRRGETMAAMQRDELDDGQLRTIRRHKSERHSSKVDLPRTRQAPGRPQAGRCGARTAHERSLLRPHRRRTRRRAEEQFWYGGPETGAVLTGTVDHRFRVAPAVRWSPVSRCRAGVRA